MPIPNPASAAGEPAAPTALVQFQPALTRPDGSSRAQKNRLGKPVKR